MKKFLSIFKKLTCRYASYDVWKDFIIVSACAISNSCDKMNYDERESLYKETIKKYNKQEQNLFPELFAEIVLQLENNLDQDFLGQLFMDLNFGDKHLGQYFTPYPISKLMSKAIIGDAVSQVRKEKRITISDPCCGSGSLLIASINEAKRQLEKENMNFQKYIYVCGQDINQLIALMCYIQLALMGVAGYISVGDSLLNTENAIQNCWFTPMYFLQRALV